jgi:hypothetical protein
MLWIHNDPEKVKQSIVNRNEEQGENVRKWQTAFGDLGSHKQSGSQIKMHPI